MLEVLILAAVLLWGLTDFLAARAARQAPALLLAAWTPLASLPVAAIAALFGADLSPGWPLIALAFISIVLLSAGKIFFYQSAKKNETSLVVAFLAAYPLVALIGLSIIGFSWPLPSELLGVLVIVAGAVILQSGTSGIRRQRSTLLGLAIMVAFGLWAVVESAALRIAAPLDMIFWVAALYSLVTPGLLLIVRRQQLPLRLPSQALKLILANQWIGYLGLFAFYQALKLGNDLIVITLTSLTPLVTGWLCIIFNEERLAWRRLGAMLIIIIGAVLTRGAL